MSTLNCQVLETVVSRELNVAVQVLDVADREIRLSLRRAGSGPLDDNRLRAAHGKLKQQVNAAAEKLNRLHELMELQRVDQLEPAVFEIYRQLLELDREIDRSFVPAAHDCVRG